VDNKITTLSRRVSGVAQLLPLEGMVVQRCVRATTTNGRDAHFTLDFRRDRSAACPTNNLDHGRALTRSHLATSQSQSLTWLSTYHQPAGPSLKLTCRSFGTSWGWTLAIPSAGPVAGAGIPVGDAGASISLVGTAVPAVRDLGFGGLGTARPTAVDKTRGGLGTLRRRSEQAARPTTAVFRTLPVGWRQPEVWIA